MRWAALLALTACAGAGSNEDWVDVRKDDLILSIEVQGQLEAVDAMPIKPPPVGDRWDYKISRMAAEAAEVKKDEIVLGFDASELQRELERVKTEAEAAAKEIDKQRADAAMARKEEDLAIANAEAAVRKAALKGDRPRDLNASIDVEVLELDRKVAELELARARSKADQARRHDAAYLEGLREKHVRAANKVREIEANIARMNVPSPRAGTVIYRSNWRGEKKKVGDSAWRMETVLEIADLAQMIARGKVDEVDAAKVAVGQRVTLRLDAHPEQELVGKVTELANTMVPVSPSNPSKVIEIEIALEESRGLPLRPGMRFRGAAETARVPQVVIVPAEAVFVTEAGPRVYKRTGDSYQKIPVELGRRNATEIEVKAGLAPGDEVSRVDLDRKAARR
jgi:HlyD family secretion protein